MSAGIFVRVMKCLKRRGLLRDEEDSHGEPQLSPTEALAQAALSRGTLATAACDQRLIDELAKGKKILQQ